MHNNDNKIAQSKGTEMNRQFNENAQVQHRKEEYESLNDLELETMELTKKMNSQPNLHGGTVESLRSIPEDPTDSTEGPLETKQKKKHPKLIKSSTVGDVLPIPEEEEHQQHTSSTPMTSKLGDVTENLEFDRLAEYQFEKHAAAIREKKSFGVLEKHFEDEPEEDQPKDIAKQLPSLFNTYKKSSFYNKLAQSNKAYHSDLERMPGSSDEHADLHCEFDIPEEIGGVCTKHDHSSKPTLTKKRYINNEDPVLSYDESKKSTDSVMSFLTTRLSINREETVKGAAKSKFQNDGRYAFATENEDSVDYSNENSFAENTLLETPEKRMDRISESQFNEPILLELTKSEMSQPLPNHKVMNRKEIIKRMKDIRRKLAGYYAKMEIYDLIKTSGKQVLDQESYNLSMNSCLCRSELNCIIINNRNRNHFGCHKELGHRNLP